MSEKACFFLTRAVSEKAPSLFLINPLLTCCLAFVSKMTPFKTMCWFEMAQSHQ